MVVIVSEPYLNMDMDNEVSSSSPHSTSLQRFIQSAVREAMVNFHKSSNSPSHRIEFLGYEVDSDGAVLLLPVAKIAAINKELFYPGHFSLPPPLPCASMPQNEAFQVQPSLRPVTHTGPRGSFRTPLVASPHRGLEWQTHLRCPAQFRVGIRCQPDGLGCHLRGGGNGRSLDGGGGQPTHQLL